MPAAHRPPRRAGPRAAVRRRRLALLAGIGVLATVAVALSNDASSPRRTSEGRSRAHASPAAERRANRGNVYAADAVGAPQAAAVRGARARVYVPNSVSGTVDVIDPASYRIVGHFAVGRYAQHITPSWDLRWLYVNNTLSNSLTVVDPRTARPVRTLPLANPYNLYFTPDGRRAIVVAESLERLDVREARTLRLLGSVHIPAAGPNHLDFSADGRSLLLSAEFSGFVVRVDPFGLRVTGRLFVGGQPIDVKLSPDGRVFYVANMARGGVSVIDPVAMKEVSFLKTASGAHGLALSRDARRLFVANRASGSISVIDLATRRVRATWNVGGTPDMMQVSPDGRTIWVSNRGRRTVSVIDATDGRVLHVIAVGQSPHGLTYFPQQGRYSLGHNGVYR